MSFGIKNNNTDRSLQQLAERLNNEGIGENSFFSEREKSENTLTGTLQSPKTFSESAPQINVSVELDGYELAKTVAAATNELNRQLHVSLIK